MDVDLLVRECIKRNPRAQKALYEHFSPEMLGVCYRYTKSVYDAEEILQEAFVKVFERIGQFRGQGELGAWVRKIMVNTAITYLKTQQRYRYDLLYDEMPLHVVSTENPEVFLDAKELADLIRQLPTGFQTVFNLYAIEGYKHEEIATILGISSGTSRSQYARGRAILIEWLEKLSSENKKIHYGRK